jgi:SAM-dependent methyltransferase
MVMKQCRPTFDEVLSGYSAVSQLYRYIPSMVIWQGWEYAAYQLSELVLDVGCGDGRFFRQVWPRIRDVVGVDIEPGIVEAARRSEVYRRVHMAPAHLMPVQSESFASVFANCSLEHMDRLPEVLNSVWRSLRSDSLFLLSVETDKFLEWATLPLLVDQLGESEQALILRTQFEAYHHLVNPCPLEVWTEHLEKAGFEILEHIPIMPEMTSRLFLFLDHLWHIRRPGGELGDFLHTYLVRLPDFPQAFQQVVAGILQAEQDWSAGSGAILWARKSR